MRFVQLLAKNILAKKYSNPKAPPTIKSNEIIIPNINGRASYGRLSANPKTPIIKPVVLIIIFVMFFM
jgi:hypothetical protein